MLRVALLDDNREQLEKYQSYLVQMGTVQVVTACSDSVSFLKETALTKPDVLFLDLNLGDSYMTGMEVAYELQLPVLFVSSNTSQYVKEMENLKRDFGICVDHLTKPFSEADYRKTVQRFLTEVDLFSGQRYVYLDFGQQKRTKIALDSIVYLAADKAQGAESNNKQIFFTNRKPENLIDFSFSKMEDKGLTKSQFLTIHKSFRVNVAHIRHYDRKTETLEVAVYTAQGKTELKQLPVSENYQSAVKAYRTAKPG